MSGISVETAGKVWDPLGLAEYVPPKWAREVELANARSAMLANVGWFWPQIYGTFNSDDVTTTDPIDAIIQADPQWWAQFIILCGVAEAWKFNKANEGQSFTGGDVPVLDWTGLWPDDEEGRAKLQLQELKNGRLAMIGFASYLSAHFISGSVPALPVDFH